MTLAFRWLTVCASALLLASCSSGPKPATGSGGAAVAESAPAAAPVDPPPATPTAGCDRYALLPLLLASKDIDTARSLWGNPVLGEPRCEGEWATARTTFASPQAQNVNVLFHWVDGAWTYVTLGGSWNCVGLNGVPADIAARLPGCH